MTIPDTPSAETILRLPAGTRVRWNETAPPRTHFGNVIGRHPVSGLLSVREENGPVWALAPGTDHIAVLGGSR